VTGGRGSESARIYDTRTGARIADGKYLGSGPVALDPDGVSFAVADGASPIRRFRLESGEEIGSAFESKSRVPRLMKFSPNGEWLTAHDPDGFNRVFDAETGRLRQTFAASVERFPLESKVDCDPNFFWWDQDGARAFYPTRNGYQVYDAKADKLDSIESLPRWILGVSPDGSVALTSINVGRIQVVGLKDGQRFGQPIELESNLSATLFHPDESTIAVGFVDGSVRFIDVSSGQWVGRSWHERNSIGALAFSVDGRLLLVGGHESATLLDLLDSDGTEPLVLPHASAIDTFALSPDGRQVLTGTVDGMACFWDLATGRPSGKAIRHDRAVAAAAFSPEGRQAGDLRRRLAQDDGRADRPESGSSQPGEKRGI
jgi:WD40 repeat protein